MPQRQLLKFPKNFLWGVTTSAHQSEGGNHNQWSVWELENARSLAARSEYEYGDLENWDNIAAEAKNPDNYVSATAVGHYDCYEKDFALAQKMGLNTWRFSIEWSRIEPTEGVWSAEAIKHYKAYIAALKAHQLEPVVTLFHFTLPVWFAQKGGFEKRSNVKYFVHYVDKLMEELGASTVRYVVTVNEPELYAYNSYYEGLWTPNETSKTKLYKVLTNLAYAHNHIAKILHEKNRRYRVGVAKGVSYAYAGDSAWLSNQSAAMLQFVKDDFFIKKVIKSSDFLGVSYYYSSRVYGYRTHNPDKEVSDVGWSLQPEHLELVLKRLYERYKKPILVTENGVADGADSRRKQWLARTIVAMQKATDSGVELIGYLFRGLYDDFDWDRGFWPHYGFFEVDRVTKKRIPRPSALWYMRFLAKQKEQKNAR